MANRYEGERGSGRWRDANDEFRNRGRSEWDDDHGNGSGHGRAFGRARFDEDNDQGRYGAQGYYDDRFNEQSSGSRSGRFDQDWSDRGMDDRRSSFDQGGWRGRGQGSPGSQDHRQGGTGYAQDQGYGQRGGMRSDEGYYGGFGGGSMGYAANREYRTTHPDELSETGYGAGTQGGFGYGETGRAQRGAGYGQGSTYGQGNMGYGQGSQSGFGQSQTNQGPYGQYSTDWAQTGRMGGGPMSQHDEDYHHWRSQQIGKLDKDYDDWRNERRKKFSDEFEKWRASRPQSPNDETLAHANPRAGGTSANSNATGSSQPGSSRNK